MTKTIKFDEFSDIISRVLITYSVNQEHKMKQERMEF